MKLTWDKNSTAYDAVEKIIHEKYSNGEDFVVQIKLRYNPTKEYREEYREITELYYNDGYDWQYPDYVWQYDWWEGEEDVELIAVAPISSLKLDKQYYV